MWKVGDINPVSVLGVDGYPYGFNLTAGDGPRSSRLLM